MSACLQHAFLFRCGCFLGASQLLLGCVSIAFSFQCTAAAVCIPFGYPNLSLSAAEWPLALRLLSESLLSLAGFVPSFLVCHYMHLPDVRLSPSRSILAAFRVLLGCLLVRRRLISGCNPIARRLCSGCVSFFLPACHHVPSVQPCEHSAVAIQLPSDWCQDDLRPPLAFFPVGYPVQEQPQ